MFRKKEHRPYLHNVRLASMLSFVAGIVNIVGVLSVSVLTTNVTGHFAYFAEDFINGKYFVAYIFLLYSISFLAGAFVSNFLIEIFHRLNFKYYLLIPMFLEMTILACLGFFGDGYKTNLTENRAIAYLLLFSMGVQNSLVTQISNSVVRTTHLTGLFTDLGIEFSRWFFFRKTSERTHLKRGIALKLYIILFFFLGCIIGGLFFSKVGIKTLLLASLFLLISLFYENIRIRLQSFRRNIRNIRYNTKKH